MRRASPAPSSSRRPPCRSAWCAPRRKSAMQVLHSKCRIPPVPEDRLEDRLGRAGGFFAADPKPCPRTAASAYPGRPDRGCRDGRRFDLFPPVAGPEPPIYTSAFDDIAVQGYDRVACFKAGKPVKGTKEFPTTRNGAEFRFASAANRDAFRKYPDACAPQYRGCCAWTVSQGYTSKGDAKFCKNRRSETVSQLQQSGAKKVGRRHSWLHRLRQHQRARGHQLDFP